MTESDILKGTKTIAEYLGVSQDVVQRLITAGRLPVFRFAPRGKWRARKAALIEHVQNLETERVTCGN